MLNAFLLATAILVLPTLAVVLFERRRREPAPLRYIERALSDLPDEYRRIAAREMDLTNRVGLVVTRRRAGFIVQTVTRLARERGAVAS